MLAVLFVAIGEMDQYDWFAEMSAWSFLSHMIKIGTRHSSSDEKTLTVVVFGLIHQASRGVGIFDMQCSWVKVKPLICNADAMRKYQ